MAGGRPGDAAPGWAAGGCGAPVRHVRPRTAAAATRLSAPAALPSARSLARSRVGAAAARWGGGPSPPGLRRARGDWALDGSGGARPTSLHPTPPRTLDHSVARRRFRRPGPGGPGGEWVPPCSVRENGGPDLDLGLYMHLFWLGCSHLPLSLGYYSSFL